MRPRPSAYSKSLAGWLACGAGDGHQRAEFCFEDSADRVAIEHVGRLPMMIGIERHVFDESQLQAAVTGEAGERNDLVFGEAVDGDGVEPNVARSRPAVRRRCPASTRSSPSRREIFWKVSSLSVSRLMLRRSRPAERSSAAASARRMPLVVRARSSMPGTCGEHFHEAWQVGADERFAAGES